MIGQSAVLTSKNALELLRQKSFLSISWLGIQTIWRLTYVWHVHDTRMVYQQNKRVKFELLYLKGVVKTST